MATNYETERAQINEDYESGSITARERAQLVRQLESERKAAKLLAPIEAAKLPYDAEIEW